MVAYDSRQTPDQERRLCDDTMNLLRGALHEQLACGETPCSTLKDAMRVASEEARERGVTPDALLLQVRAIADGIGGSTGRGWMVRVCLRAYWEMEDA